MIVVADSSVLVGLSSIGKLYLLKVLFGEEILIPPAVWSEVVEHGGGRPGAKQIESSEWIVVKTVNASDLLQLLKVDLDIGEAEAIALAKKIKADLILLDERDARKIAKSLSLKILGTIGILIKAKQIGEIESLQDVLDTLRNKAQFRVSDSFYSPDCISCPAMYRKIVEIPDRVKK